MKKVELGFEETGSLRNIGSDSYNGPSNKQKEGQAMKETHFGVEICLYFSLCVKTVMKPFLYERLMRALLLEMASGLYGEGENFLSLRAIRRLWNVSEPTARSSIALLEEAALLESVPRSGYRLKPGFQERALLLLHRSPGTSLPLQSNWRDKRWRLLRGEGIESARRIGLVLEVQSTDRSRKNQNDVAALEAARTFFQDANRDGCDVLHFYRDGSPANEDFLLKEIEYAQLDAVVIFRRFFISGFPTFLKRLEPCRIPVVTVFDNYEEKNAFSINFNNIGAGFSAAQIVLERRERRVAALVPSRLSQNLAHRLHGFLLGLKEFAAHGVAPTFETLQLPVPGESLGEIKERLSDRNSRPSAIFVLGISNYFQLRNRAIKEGWRIPRDIKILACGNPNLLQKRDRNVEILLLDFSEIGRRAYRYVQKILDGSPVERMFLLPVPYIGSGANREAKPTVAF